MQKARSKIEVTKLDAARHQLEQAIDLYFQYGDEFSTQTLVGAAYAILRDINEHRGGKAMLKDLHRLLEPGEANEFRKWINRPENFFKHAARDPDGVYVLDCRWTEVLMWEASLKYCELVHSRPLLVLYIGWFIAQHPEVGEKLVAEGLQGKLTAMTRRIPRERRKFRATLLPLFQSKLSSGARPQKA